MENASKALIIAGAILLSILIIALGIFVFNAAKGAVNTDQLDATALQTFNGQFEQYEGKQSGANVKSLLSACITSAAANAESEERLPDIKYKHKSGTAFKVGSNNVKANNTYNVITNMSNQRGTETSNLRSFINNTHTYTVTFGYNTQGYVNMINITY